MGTFDLCCTEVSVVGGGEARPDAGHLDQFAEFGDCERHL